jgi:hypothetical protein
MSTVNDCTAYSGFAGNLPPYSQGAAVRGVQRLHVSIADQITYLGAAISGSGGDSIKIWTIPAFTHVKCVGVYLWKVDAAPTATITIGDSDGAAYWLASFTLGPTAGTQKMTLISDVNGLTFGKSYNAADYLKVTFGTAGVTTAIFDVFIEATQFFVPDLATSAPATWK